MKLSGKNINITSPLLLLALAAALLLTAPACIREDFPTDCAEQGKEVTLQIKVAAAPTTKAERAVDDIETAIYSLRVLAYYNGALAGEEYIDKEDKSVLNDEDLTFNMDISMYIIGNNQIVNFYVIANEGAMLDESNKSLNLEGISEADLKTRKFSTIYGVHPVSFDKGMPNIAKKTYALMMSETHVPVASEGPHKDHSLITEIREVDANGNPIGDPIPEKQLSFKLERPVGKLSIYAAKASNASQDDKVTITAARLLPNGTRKMNYVLPQDLTILKEIEDEQPKGYNLHISQAEGGTVLVDKILPETTDDTKSTDPNDYNTVLVHDYYPHENAYGTRPSLWAWDMFQTYYDPVHGNDGTLGWTAAEDKPAAVADYKGNILEIDYYLGDDPNTGVKKGTVYLPPIIRNHHYQIFCTINTMGSINITYSVAAWEDAEQWKDGFTYQYPDYTDIFPTEAEAGEYVYKNPQFNQLNPFKANFYFYGPPEGLWTPALGIVKGDPQNYSFEVYQNGSLVTPSTETGIDVKVYKASSAVYTIHVKANSDTGVDDSVVKLGISFIPAWMTTGEKMMLLINGGALAETTTWPDSGNDPLWIEIEHVSTISNQ